jgi:hypothetical protein
MNEGRGLAMRNLSREAWMGQNCTVSAAFSSRGLAPVFEDLGLDLAFTNYSQSEMQGQGKRVRGRKLTEL